METKTFKHLSADDRIRIESLLHEGFSIRYIADRLGKSPSTVSREIRKHTSVIRPKQCDCLFSADCTLRHVCGSVGCRKKCKTCPKAKNYCTDYSQALCDTLLDEPTHLCNRCGKRGQCHYERRVYSARTAESEYRDTLVHSRDGFDLTAEQFGRINDIVSPLVRRGQSIYHITQTNRESIGVSESTVRRLISANEMDVINLDLPEAVKRKPRRKHHKHASPSAKKEGHLYGDYLAYIRDNDVPVVQMDCVEGAARDSAAMLTLHFTQFHMQLAYILDRQDSACVVAMLNTLEYTLGSELFAQCFPLILTDNGHEFSDIENMERSISGGQRTKVFFCEPNRSDQKGQCENNHKLIRDIIPKGTSIENLRQPDMVLLTNHINSYVRKSLFGRCPYELAMTALPEDLFILLGLERIPANDVMLTPKLLK